MQGNLIQPNERVQDLNYDFSLRDKWAKISGIDGMKFTIKPVNDSTVILRVHNLDDTKSKKISLFANDTSPFLTTYYGNLIKFQNIEETSMGANMKYEQFLKEKWNWKSVIDLDI